MSEVGRRKQHYASGGNSGEMLCNYLHGTYFSCVGFNFSKTGMAVMHPHKVPRNLLAGVQPAHTAQRAVRI
jgi:hypothetical protein